MDMGSDAANAWANAHTLVPELKTIFAAYPYPETHFGFYIGTNDEHIADQARLVASAIGLGEIHSDKMKATGR